MSILVFKSKLNFFDKFSGYKIKKFYIDKVTNIILIVQDLNSRSYIIYYNEKDEIEKYSLSSKTNIEDILCVQSIEKNKWLFLYNYDRDNAFILDNRGEVLSKFSVGEGIQDCQVDMLNNIWISYCDEGVYGESEIAKAGIVALNSSGNPVFNNYEKIVNSACIPPIDDCYAMNVCSNKVWLYYYSDFPLVCLKDNSLYEWFPNINLGENKNSKGFAVGQNKILFGTESKKLILYSVDTKNYETIIPYDEFHQELTFISYIGRGSFLYLQTTNGLYVTDLEKMDLCDIK